MLQGQRHDGGEARRVVDRRTGTAVLADGQVDVHAGRPNGVERRVEEGTTARDEGRHHDAAQTVLLGPMDVGHGQLHVVERHQGLAGAPAWRLRAEIDQPAVVGEARLAVELGVREALDVVRGSALEGQPVGEQDLGHDALGLHVLQAQIGVPLRGGVESGAEVAALGRPDRLLGLDPLVVGTEILLLDVVAVVEARRPHVSVHRDDRGACHHPPFRAGPFWRGGAPSC